MQNVVKIVKQQRHEGSCDFCGAVPTARPAQGMSNPVFRVGTWSACVSCVKLVDAKKWDVLVNLIVVSQQSKFPGLRGVFNKMALTEAVTRTIRQLCSSLR